MNTISEGYIARLLNQLKLRITEAEYVLVEGFAQKFWGRTLEEELGQRDVGDDAGATIQAWRQMNAREPDQISFHLSNPNRARDGWHSSHTIVEVTAPNMPFMVDSVLMALSHDGLVTHHLNNVVYAVERDESGAIKSLSDDHAHGNRELLVYAEIDRLEDAMLPALQERLEAMAGELRAVVEDFESMKKCVTDLVKQLREHPPLLPSDEVEEGISFLLWLLDNHFTFLGYREFSYVDGVIRQTGEAYGMQRVRQVASERLLAEQPAETIDFLLTPRLLSFSKSGTKSRVHRPAYPDYIGVRCFDADGQVIGEIGFLGLYTSRVYQEFPERIPVLRRKVANTLANSGLDPHGFDGKVLERVLATFPRDELFQISDEQLMETALTITDIHERRRVRVFVRHDAYGLFVTTLVYMPRDLFHTGVRLKLHALLVETFDAEDSDHDIYLSESILVRVQFNLRIKPGSRVEVDRLDLERRITEFIGDWASDLHSALIAGFGEAGGRKLHRKYADAFPAGYKEQFDARAATDDVAAIEALSNDASLSTRFYRLPEDPATSLRLKIFHLGDALPLSDVVPKLENLGLRVNTEHPYSIHRPDQAPASVHDYELEFGAELDLRLVGDDFDAAFVRIWDGEVEDDGFNRLILTAGLDWREVSVLRAYSQYMKQIRFGFSQAFISDTLLKHHDIASVLVTYFERLFNPDAQADDVQTTPEQVSALVLDMLDRVQLLNEDRILRKMLEVMGATTRTNYFVRDAEDQARTCLALKLEPRRITGVPRPVPMFEIFVSAPSFEGVHLRGGPIARGGLRWSDRHEDYRTEVLGLVKAQVVKNAVIVPTGAKGGFVLKGAREGVECYREFIGALLDVTDNIVNAEVVTPENVKALDAPDPYLVVAADKGTATFSDEANSVAEARGFWLGDAFASGGSNGYDHKKMGITARGAWISVQRHFSERGIDVQSQPVSVLGIGDMGGDVFGNGMLLSRCLKVVAAFNHLHIFIDPDPDPELSYVERERLFALPRSKWSDYNPQLISPGGGVFARSEKSIKITQAMRDVFGIAAEQLAPDELIHELLKSPVQLIWNGGIGTYAKATAETHDEVGDRGNDHLRVNASEMRCTVFGEGGNLGLTQRARIEFSLAGGSVNTDFIDNSAGVDCSDHEVNIKIALNEAVVREDMTTKQRNELLARMTDDVAELVLQNNYNQAHALSLAQRHATTRGSEYQRSIGYLEQHAGLDRELEYLPTFDQLADRFSEDKSLTRPELAVLLAYAKTFIKEGLLDSEIFADPIIADQVLTCFPAALTAEHEAAVRTHRLSREIIATQLANRVVDHMGISFVVRQIEFVGGSVADVVCAHAAVSECFELGDWFEAVKSLEQTPADIKLALWLEVMRLGRRATRWFLRNEAGVSVSDLTAKYRPCVQALLNSDEHRTGVDLQSRQERISALVAVGVPDELARRSVDASDLANLLPVTQVAQQTGVDQAQLAAFISVVGHEMEIDWVAERVVDLPTQSHWQSMERDSLLDDLMSWQCRLASMLLSQGREDVRTWLADSPRFTRVWRDAVHDARHAAIQDFSMYSILGRKLGALCSTLGC